MYAIRSYYEFGNFHFEGIEEVFSGNPFAEAHEDAVVPSGDGTEDFLEIHAVQGARDHVGMAGIGLNYHHIEGVFDGDVPAQEILNDGLLRLLALFVAGKGVYVSVVAVGKLSDFQELEVPGQGGLGDGETFAGQVAEQGFLRFDPIGLYELSDRFKAGQSFFHVSGPSSKNE